MSTVHSGSETSPSKASPSKEKKLKPSSSLPPRGHYAFHISPSRTIYHPLPPSKFKLPSTSVSLKGGGAKGTQKKKTSKLDVFDFHSDDSDYEFDMPMVDYQSSVPVRVTGKTSKTGSGIGQKRGRGRSKKAPKEPLDESDDDESAANESKPTSQEPVVKRGRGHSKKILNESITSEPDESTGELTPVVKRGRGRPRKTPKLTNESTPNESTASEPESTGRTPVVKRGRGRPRKTPTTSQSSANVSTASEPEPNNECSTTGQTPVKRGRGRPRKTPTSQSTASEPEPNNESTGQKPVVKRGRGRPRKIRKEVMNESTASETELVHEFPVNESGSSSQQSVVKRGRGRPRKHTNSSPAVSTPSSQEPGVKRGRGRPRKVVSTPNESIGTVTPSSTDVSIQIPSTIETGDDEGIFLKTDATGIVEDMGEEPVPTILDIIEKGEKGTLANSASMEEVTDTTAETTTIVITVPPDPTSFSSLYDISAVPTMNKSTTDSELTDMEGETTSKSVTIGAQKKTSPDAERSHKNDNEEEEASNTMEPMQQGDVSLSEETPLVGTCTKEDIGLTSDSSAKQNTSTAPSTIEQTKEATSPIAQSEPENPVKPSTPVKRTSSTSSTGSTSIKEPALVSEAGTSLPVPLAKSVSDTSSYKIKQDAVQYSVTLPKTKSNKPDIPSLSRSLTWPKTSEEKQNEDDSTIIVRNVRHAHECLQHGENLRFRDDVIYLLDSMKPEEPLLVRCLSTLNLAEQCLNVVFMRQMRSLGLVKKSLLLLKDAQTQPALKVSMVTLCFVMTQSNVEASELDKKCTELLMMGLSVKDGYQFVSSAEEEEPPPLEGKAANEYKRITDKSKVLLKKCSPLLIHAKYSETNNADETVAISLQPSALSLGELATECLLSLTSSTNNSVLSLKEDLRTLGAIDLLANRAIALTRHCTGYLTSDQEEKEGEREEGEEGEERDVDVHFMKLFRQLKLLENILCMSKGNQSYLTVFDGSVFILEISKFLVLLGNYLISKDLNTRHTFIVTETLLGTLRVFLNITHDNALASYRVGEQEKIIDSICNFIFKLAQNVPAIQQFDILVLCLSLLINLLEESSSNVQHVSSVFIDVTSTCDNPYGDMLATQALVKLFLTHYEKGESASVDVPTPTKQVIPHESPAKSPKTRKDLTTFTSRMKSGVQPVPKKVKQREEEKMEGDEAESKEQEEEEDEEEEEEEENISFDPLIFKREDFDSALSQAGKHMEDSIISSYSAVLVALLIQNDSEFAVNVKNKLPDGNFSSLIKVLKDFLSFMNMASSGSTKSGLDSVQRILKFLSAMD